MATTIKTEGVLYINGKQVYNSFNKVRNAVVNLRNDLKKCKIGTKDFQETAAKLRKAEAHFAAVKQEIYGVNKELEKSGNVFSRLYSKVGGFGGFVGLMNIGGGIYGVQQTVSYLLDVADAITDVEKTSGLATEKVGELWHEFSELNTRTSKLDLMKIATIGGRLGIKSKEELKAFTEEIDKAYIALGDSFEGGLQAVTTQLGKMKSLFKDTKDLDYATAINKIGSALNELAANGTSSESNISDFTLRVGALPGALKPAADKVLALGAAFEESGVDSRIAASGFTRFMLQASNNLDAFAYSMNMSTKEAKKLLESHPEKFFLRFSAGMKGLDPTVTAKIFKDLGLNTQEVIKAVGAAGDKAERFTEVMKLSSKAMAEATSLTNEFNKKNNNSAAIWEKIIKGLKDFVTDGIVPEVLNGFMSILGSITGVSEGISIFRKRLFLLTKTVGVVIVSFVSLKTAIWLSSVATKNATLQNILFRNSVIANSVAVKMYKGVVLLLMKRYYKLIGNTHRATVATKAFSRVVKANPWGFLASVLITVGSALYMFWDRSKKVNKALSEQEQKAKAVADANKTMADESIKSVSKYKTAVEPLISLLKDQNATLDMRKRAYKALVNMYPEFEGILDGEKVNVAKLSEVYETLAKRIKEAAIARGMQKLYAEAADKVAEAKLKVYEAKLAKDKEDKANAEWDKKIKETREGKGSAYAKGVALRVYYENKTYKANDAYKEAVKELKEKQLQLTEIEKLQKEKVAEYEKQVNDISKKIKEKEAELSKVKGDKLKSAIEKEIAKLQSEKKTAENALYRLTGVTTSEETGNNRGSETNKELTVNLKSAVSNTEKMSNALIDAQYKLQSELLALQSNGQQKEIEQIELQTQRKIDKIHADNQRIRIAYSEAKEQINSLSAKMNQSSTKEAEKKEIAKTIAQLKKAQKIRSNIIKTNNETEEVLEKIKHSKIKAIRVKYSLKSIEEEAKINQRKIKQLKIDREKEILDITSLEEAKKAIKENAFAEISDKELANIKSLEQAKKVLREAAAKEVLKRSLEILKTQRKAIATEMQNLPEGAAKDKLVKDLQEVDEKANSIRAKLQSKSTEDDGRKKEEQEALEQTDILGFSAADWDRTFSNLDTFEGKLAAVGMAFSALGNAASMYAQHQKNVNDAEMIRFTKNQEKKKKALATALNAGIITQEEYYAKMQKMEVDAEAKKRELALKQAKAEKALGAAQLAIVAGQQLPKYNKGGFTNGLGFKDESGYEVAGAVHANEYVIPAWLLQKPAVANVAQWLEAKRIGKDTPYVAGGPVGKDVIPTVQEEEPQQDNTTYKALIQVLYQLGIVLSEIEKNGGKCKKPLRNIKKSNKKI